MNGKVSVTRPGAQILKRGQTLEFPINIERSECDDTVLLRFENLPAGVAVLEPVVLHRGKSKAFCQIRATDEAGLVAQHQARIVATGAGIAETTQWLQLAVSDPHAQLPDPVPQSSPPKVDPEGLQ